MAEDQELDFEMRLDMSFRKNRAYLFSRHEQISFHNARWASNLAYDVARSQCFSVDIQSIWEHSRIFSRW